MPLLNMLVAVAVGAVSAYAVLLLVDHIAWYYSKPARYERECQRLLTIDFEAWRTEWEEGGGESPWTPDTEALQERAWEKVMGYER